MVQGSRLEPSVFQSGLLSRTADFSEIFGAGREPCSNVRYYLLFQLQQFINEFIDTHHDVNVRAGGQSIDFIKEPGLPAFAGNDMSVARIK